jgi:hypothetical protein
MLKPMQIVALEQRLDYAISKFDVETELFVQSHLGRYLVILTAGYVEQTIQSALTDFARRTAHPDIALFVSNTLAWEGSINRDKLSKILKRFNGSWYEEIESAATDAEKNAIDSIKELRDQLAHGLDNGTGYGVIKNYHLLVRSYVDRVLVVLP